jgi:hypothetical protein
MIMNNQLLRLNNFVQQYYDGKISLIDLEIYLDQHTGESDTPEMRKAMRELDANIEMILYSVGDDKQAEEVKKSMDFFLSQISGR